MNRNKITDKLLYTFGISAILFCSSSLPVLAQQRYPTAAAIQKARNQLRQRLGVLSSNGRLRDSRSQSEKQTRNNFVAAWNKIDPDVAPFLGHWRGYEGSFAIYPSNRKGQVCIMMSSFGWMDIEMGKVSNGNIYTDTGGLFFKEGNYLDLAAPLKNGGLSEGIPLHAPMPLKEPSIDEEIEDRYKAAKVIRAYKQAGCTASLASNNNASQTSVENLADGFYLYGEVPNADGFGKHYVVFGKSGKTITGYSYVTNSDNVYCFQGTARGNQIVNATSITRILNPPNSYDAISSNQSLNLNGFYAIKSSEESKRKSAAYCLEKINKNITNNTAHQTIRVPNSFQVIIENNGMNTQFVKGKDGYYTWFWKDRPGTCLGLRENKNPAKVQLATYNCNSRKKARTWEILMVNNNTGYKVKLPNTSYCLRDNIGIVNCNSSEATVKNLTPQQLEQFTVTPRP